MKRDICFWSTRKQRKALATTTVQAKFQTRAKTLRKTSFHRSPGAWKANGANAAGPIQSKVLDPQDKTPACEDFPKDPIDFQNRLTGKPAAAAPRHLQGLRLAKLAFRH